jgi:hypothetical protein
MSINTTGSRSKKLGNQEIFIQEVKEKLPNDAQVFKAGKSTQPCYYD